MYIAIRISYHAIPIAGGRCRACGIRSGAKPCAAPSVGASRRTHFGRHTKGEVSQLGRIIRPDRRGRHQDQGDTGFTLVEVVLAIAILTVAVAATTAAISLAASARREGGVQITAAEIANQVLQQAEAFGCGLPVDYNGVSATDRLAACDYNGSEAGGDGLADVDFTTVRDGQSFDVEVRMRWLDELETDPAYFPAWNPPSNPSPCRWRALWFNGYGTQFNPPVASLGTLPAGPSSPSLLHRTVTVDTPNGRTVTLKSAESVRPDLADHYWGYMINVTNRVIGKEVKLERYEPDTSTGTKVWEMTLHTDSLGCVWFPFISEPNSDYKINNIDAGGGEFCVTDVTVNPDGICNKIESA